MLFQWNEQTIRWISDGAEYTGFYRNLAALLLPRIRRRGSLCDIGCGLAQVDFALAPFLESVSCADVSDVVLDSVRRRISETDTRNMTVIRSEGAALTGRWDTVTAIFHGSVEKDCVNYLRKAADRLIFVTHGSGKSAEKLCNDADLAANWLDSQGWRYEKQLGELEFGQPFRSHADAAAWAEAFHGSLTAEESRTRVLTGLEETGRRDFPLYLSKRRSFGIFVIPREENEHLLQQAASPMGKVNTRTT